MSQPGLYFLFAAMLFLTSCSVLQESAKYKFNDGVYHRRALAKGQAQIISIGDSIVVTNMTRTAAGKTQPDTLHRAIYTSTLKKNDTIKQLKQLFYRSSFDLDFLTILAKLRPPVPSLPAQLNTTTYNGALYAGYRIDGYRLHYDRTTLGLLKRSVDHYGYSAGFFTGIGATPMNQYVTGPAIDYEYDGFIIASGIAFTVAVQNLTFGLALGQDRLLDRNHQAWRYQGKPWIGLALGLNLN